MAGCGDCLTQSVRHERYSSKTVGVVYHCTKTPFQDFAFGTSIFQVSRRLSYKKKKSSLVAGKPKSPSWNTARKIYIPFGIPWRMSFRAGVVTSSASLHRTAYGLFTGKPTNSASQVCLSQPAKPVADPDSWNRPLVVPCREKLANPEKGQIVILPR